MGNARRDEQLRILRQRRAVTNEPVREDPDVCSDSQPETDQRVAPVTIARQGEVVRRRAPPPPPADLAPGTDLYNAGWRWKGMKRIGPDGVPPPPARQSRRRLAHEI